MKTYQLVSRLKTIPVIVAALFIVSACNLPFLSSAAATTEASVPTGSAPVETAVIPVSGASAGDCLVGNWQVTNYPEYIASLTNMFPQGSSGDLTVNDQGSTGTIQMQFGADGTATFKATDFTEKFSMTTTQSGSALDIPIDIAMNGSGTSGYSVTGDQISFSNQNQGDLSMSISIMGTPTQLDSSLFGTQGTVTVYQYSCIDSNTLSLKVIIVNRDLAPLKFTRVQ